MCNKYMLNKDPYIFNWHPQQEKQMSKDKFIDDKSNMNKEANNTQIIDKIKIKSFSFDKLEQNIESFISVTNEISDIDNVFIIEKYQKPIKLNNWFCPRCANKITQMDITQKGMERTCSKCGYKVILKRISRRKCQIDAIAPE